MKIVYKVLNSITVLAAIPVLIFLPMFRFIMSIGVSSNNQILSLLGSLFDVSAIIQKATGVDFNSLPEFYTIKEAYDTLLGDSSIVSTAGLDTSALPEEVTKYFSAAAILFAVALLFAVVVLIIGLVTKKKLICSAFAAGGMLSLFAANKCFTHIASQLVSGKISLMSMIENMEALSSYSKYLDYIDVDIRIFELSSAYTMLMLIFGAMIALNIVFHLVDSTSTR